VAVGVEYRLRLIKYPLLAGGVLPLLRTKQSRPERMERTLLSPLGVVDSVKLIPPPVSRLRTRLSRLGKRGFPFLDFWWCVFSLLPDDMAPSFADDLFVRSFPPPERAPHGARTVLFPLFPFQEVRGVS